MLISPSPQGKAHKSQPVLIVLYLTDKIKAENTIRVGKGVEERVLSYRVGRNVSYLNLAGINPKLSMSV